MTSAPPITREEILQEINERRAAAKSLYEFVKQAWYWIEGVNNFVDNWHIGCIAEHLEALRVGEIKRLLINQPPRTGKTNLVSVAFPAWTWIHEPETRFLYASYGLDLSMDASTKCRSLIESEWYQARWGHLYNLDPAQNTKTRFDNNRKGYRIATSVGGATTGFGGDIIIGDDLNSTSDVSETLLNTTRNWHSRTFSTRFNNLRTGRMVIVQQRVHQSDISGSILENDNGEWTKLIIPMEFEPERRFYTIPIPSTNGDVWTDPRKTDGELLWPTQIGAKELKLLKDAFENNEYVIAGQLQQRPAPLEGGIIKRGWFRLWPANKRFPRFEYIVGSYDTASKDKMQNDPSGCQVWGIFEEKSSEDEEGRWAALLCDLWAERLPYPDLKKRMLSEFKENTYGDPPKSMDLILVEDKSSGVSIIQDLQQAGLPVRAYNPGKADKMQRLHMASSIIEGGMIYVPESQREERRGKVRDWVEPFLQEVCMFPNAKHDEMVDCLSQFIYLVKDMGFLTGLKAERHNDFEEEDTGSSRITNNCYMQ